SNVGCHFHFHRLASIELMGDQQRQRYQVQLSLRQKYQQQLEQLRRDSEQKGTYNTDDYRKAEQALTESLNRQLNENRRYWQQLEVVQGNWKNGVLRAFQDFTVDADNTAGTAEQVFSSAFSNMGNGLATFVTTGKLNFKSFTSSVLSDMAKILAQATMMKSIKGIGSVLGFDLSSLSLNANGGIYQSADLSRYSGTVVNRPTFFAFAKGAGVMGEAGPEAILPLRRGADGKLGVVADIGGSGMVMFAPQYNIEINNDGTNGQIGPAALKVVYDLGKKAAADFMQQQSRDGGQLSAGSFRQYADTTTSRNLGCPGGNDRERYNTISEDKVMEEVDFITAVRNAAYNEYGAITCEVQFEGAVDTRGEPIWSPFTATSSDVTDYGRQLYHDLVNGKYGTVSPFTVSPEMLAVAKAAKRQEIETWRTEQETQSFTFEWNGRTWNAGPDSLARLYPVVMAAKSDTARTALAWGDADNQQVKLSMPELEELAAAMAQAQVDRNDEIYRRQREMKEELNNLDDLSSIRAFGVC
ncbi:phage tail tape measure protein, partial [Escherichia coli O6:H10]